MSYRITNSMMVDRSLMNLNRNLHNVEKWSEQVYTTRRINNLSDDPVGLVIGMSARSHIYRLETYQSNLSTAQMMVRESEGGLNSITTIIGRAYDLSIDAGNDSIKTDKERNLIAEEIKQMMASLLDCGNFVADGRYMFGGYNTVNDNRSQRPFTLDQVTGEILYNGIPMRGDIESDPVYGDDFMAELDNHLKVEIGFNSTWMDVSLNGIEVMGIGENNFYNILNDLYMAMSRPDYEIRVSNVVANGTDYDVTFEVVDKDGTVKGAQTQTMSEFKKDGKVTLDFSADGLGNITVTNRFVDIDFSGNDADILASFEANLGTHGINTADDVTPIISRLQRALDRNLANIAKLGAIDNRITMLDSRYDTEIVNYTKRMSDVEDADMSEATLKLEASRAVYQAALAACAKIIQPTLLDYMR